MRHVRSILYALVLSVAAWILVAVGLTGDLTARGRDGFAVESFTGLLMLILGGAAYGILVFAPTSPAGPSLAGLVYLGIGVWAVESPGGYAGVWPAGLVKPGFDVSRPGYGLAVLLAVPLLFTALNSRRWQRYEPPVLPIIGQIFRPRGEASVAGTPLASVETTILPKTGIKTVSRTPDAAPTIALDDPTTVITVEELTTVIALDSPTTVIAAEEQTTLLVAEEPAEGVADEPAASEDLPATEAETADGAGEQTEVTAPEEPAEEPTEVAVAEEPAEEPTEVDLAEEPAEEPAEDAADSTTGEEVDEEPTAAVEPGAEAEAEESTPEAQADEVSAEPEAEDEVAADAEPDPEAEPEPVAVAEAEGAAEEPTADAVAEVGEGPTGEIPPDHITPGETAADEDAPEGSPEEDEPGDGQATTEITRSTRVIPLPRPGVDDTRVIRLRPPSAEMTQPIRLPIGDPDRTQVVRLPPGEMDKTQAIPLSRGAEPKNPQPGESTQVIRFPGERTQHIPRGTNDETQIIRLPQRSSDEETTTLVTPPGERTEVLRRPKKPRTGKTSIADVERPDFESDPTSRIVPPAPRTEDDETARSMTVMNMERPPEDDD